MKTGQNKECGTLLLVSLSAAAFAAARVPSNSSLAVLLSATAGFIGGPWLLWLVLRTSERRQSRPPAAASFSERLERWTPLFFAAWTLAPLGWEWATRRFGHGESMEIQMLVCLQNAALIAAVFSHRQRCGQIACLLSAFLALFAIVLSNSPAAYVLAGLFGASMLWWLMARYWERVRQTVAAGQTDRCLPARCLCCRCCSLLCIYVAGTPQKRLNGSCCPASISGR